MELLPYLSQRISRAPYSSVMTTELRFDMVKALINSYPPTQAITINEFKAACQYKEGKSNSNANGLIVRMLQGGDIGRVTLPNGGYAYKVLIPGNEYLEERRALKEVHKMPIVDGYQQSEPKLDPVIESAIDLGEAIADHNAETASVVDKDYIFDNPSHVNVYQPQWTLKQLEEQAIRYKFYHPNDYSIPGFLEWIQAQ